MKKVFVFDVYGTLFDVYSVKKICEEMYPEMGNKISQLWRKKQLEYSFLRQLMGNYIDFFQITKDALLYTCQKLNVEVTEEKLKKLVETYDHLKPYPETLDVLTALKNCKKVIFTNGTYNMIEKLLKNSNLHLYFDEIISVDEIKQYKPTPMCYHLVVERLQVGREKILFISSNTWDIAGAKNFGFQTAWINRNHEVMDLIGIEPDFIYKDLTELLQHA
jgi:2-haloacid dehalogenase